MDVVEIGSATLEMGGVYEVRPHAVQARKTTAHSGFSETRVCSVIVNHRYAAHLLSFHHHISTDCSHGHDRHSRAGMLRAPAESSCLL